MAEANGNEKTAFQFIAVPFMGRKTQINITALAKIDIKILKAICLEAQSPRRKALRFYNPSCNLQIL
ncbi:MAG: hypothetical protein H7289_12425 [Mucilaginibacter sp.]|nr:hypothetical protein [Mucilaginibacter sp.]